MQIILESVTCVFVIVVPSTVGYLHAIFPFMITHFVSCYLEILGRLKHTVTASIDLKAQIYTQLRNHVATCMHIFGGCIVLDMTHSIVRIILCSYFLVGFSNRNSPVVRGAINDAVTVLAYSFLIWMLCKTGSQLENESEEVIEKLDGDNDNLQILDGRNIELWNVTGRKLKQIFLKTDYFKVNLGLIAPVINLWNYVLCKVRILAWITFCLQIVGTVTTNLIVMIQFKK